MWWVRKCVRKNEERKKITEEAITRTPTIRYEITQRDFRGEESNRDTTYHPRTQVIDAEATCRPSTDGSNYIIQV